MLYFCGTLLPRHLKTSAKYRHVTIAWLHHTQVHIQTCFGKEKWQPFILILEMFSRQIKHKQEIIWKAIGRPSSHRSNVCSSYGSIKQTVSNAILKNAAQLKTKHLLNIWMERSGFKWTEEKENRNNLWKCRMFILK